MEWQTLLHNLYGVEQPVGCTDQEITAVKEIYGAASEAGYAALTEVMEGLEEPL